MNAWDDARSWPRTDQTLGANARQAPRVKEAWQEAVAEVHGCCEADFLCFVQADALREHVTLTAFNLLRSCREGNMPQASSGFRGAKRKELPGFLKVGTSTLGVVVAVWLPTGVEDDATVHNSFGSRAFASSSSLGR